MTDMSMSMSKWYFKYVCMRSDVISIKPTQVAYTGANEGLINIDIPEIPGKDAFVISGLIAAIIAYNFRELTVLGNENLRVSMQDCLVFVDQHLYRLHSMFRWVYHNAIDQLLKQKQPFNRILVMPTKYDQDGDVIMWR